MTHRVVVKLIRNTLAAVTLGFATTCAVSALLGAALPHRNLLRHLQFASVHDFSSPVVEVERFTRTGMERRFWRVHEFGTHYGPSPLWNSCRTIPEPADGRDIDMPAAALWDGVGRVVAQRAERGSGTEDARGWPALAFWCELVAAPHPRPSSVRANGGISLSATDGSVSIGAFRCIRYHPIWPGVALDTAFYAALWTIPILATPLAKRHYRRRRGACPSCAYDLRSDLTQGCPECGWRRTPSGL